jgi:hypothetical protein
MPIANTYSTGNLLFSWNGSVPTNYTTQYEAFCDAHTLSSDAYATGGYESATSPFGPSVADDLIAGQLKLMNGLYK